MEYEILGDNLPVVVCNLENEESIISEGGGMSWMSPNMKMETTTRGGVGKAFGRMFSGEKMFQNRYTAKNGPGMIAFASSFPGSIMAFNISSDNSIVAQKRAFLACEEGVELSIFFNKKISGGFFGGEGFIMQKLSGEGLAFIEIDGHAVEYTLEEGQSIVVDTGHLAAMDSTCSLEVKSVPGVKNILFGGEGLFNTIITGPGRVVLQSMPLSNIAGAIGSLLPSGN
ncbi:MAG: TIGR00266 family protein [Miniphocaeibacter sp.]|uniref:TIGR00266 family protein n=1 Tax=Miniphocaeibacter sp. TaxID=3100973 RepID=UPI0017D2C071|nr:TIGR00266 family protein [Gallicola sp.]